MKTLKDNGAVLALFGMLAIAGAGWLSNEGGRSQQLADLTQQVTRLEQQVAHMQQELDQYLLVHDGH